MGFAGRLAGACKRTGKTGGSRTETPAGYLTVLTSGAKPWMRTSSVSSDSIDQMPDGVPVRMMSPGSRVMFVEMKLTSSEQLKIICAVEEFWQSCPFLNN